MFISIIIFRMQKLKFTRMYIWVNICRRLSLILLLFNNEFNCKFSQLQIINYLIGLYNDCENNTISISISFRHSILLRMRLRHFHIKKINKAYFIHFSLSVHYCGLKDPSKHDHFDELVFRKFRRYSLLLHFDLLRWSFLCLHFLVQEFDSFPVFPDEELSSCSSSQVISRHRLDYILHM